MYTSSTIMNFILEGKIFFTETEWKCKTSLLLKEVKYKVNVLSLIILHTSDLRI
jgi:hypothetical protein